MTGPLAGGLACQCQRGPQLWTAGNNSYRGTLLKKRKKKKKQPRCQDLDILLKSTEPRVTGRPVNTGEKRITRLALCTD